MKRRAAASLGAIRRRALVLGGLGWSVPAWIVSAWVGTTPRLDPDLVMREGWILRADDLQKTDLPGSDLQAADRPSPGPRADGAA